MRTRVHEYGGGAYTVSRGTVWFSNFADQRLYRQDPGREPRPITEAVDRRYADAVVDRERGLLFAVREDHTDLSREAVNTLVRLGLDGEGEVSGALAPRVVDQPQVSPVGEQADGHLRLAQQPLEPGLRRSLPAALVLLHDLVKGRPDGEDLDEH